MVHPLLPRNINGDHQNLCSMPLAIGLFLSIIALIALCAKHGRPRKYHTTEKKQSDALKFSLCAEFEKGSDHKNLLVVDQEINYEEKMVAQKSSPLLLSTKQLITTISSKTVPKKYSEKSNVMTKNGSNIERGEFGHNEGGLWQKAILMGEKCKPPQFSGVIYYDPFGNRVSELPRSPRASPMARPYASPNT